MEDDAKKQILNSILTRTDNLLNMFEASLKKEPFIPGQIRDFSKVTEKTLKREDIKEETASEDLRYGMTLENLKKEAQGCTRCGLCNKRTHVVFGEGYADRPDVMVIGEGPGENEDLMGRPFVGASGQYLDKWLASISLYRDRNCYIANTVKCRPPENRTPLDEEKEKCRAFLQQQIALIKPRAILCLGKSASTEITGMTNSTMGSLRGRFFFYDKSIPVLCTYHPSAVLRDLSLKVAVWEDLKKLASFLNLEINGARK